MANNLLLPPVVIEAGPYRGVWAVAGAWPLPGSNSTLPHINQGTFRCLICGIGKPPEDEKAPGLHRAEEAQS